MSKEEVLYTSLYLVSPIMSLSYSQGSWGHIELLPIKDSRDLAKFGDTLFTLQIICKIPILSLSDLWTPINADREVINYLTFGHRMPPATIPHNCLSQTTPIAAACREWRSSSAQQTEPGMRHCGCWNRYGTDTQPPDQPGPSRDAERLRSWAPCPQRRAQQASSRSGKAQWREWSQHWHDRVPARDQEGLRPHPLLHRPTAKRSEAANTSNQNQYM